jgi:hypothetical protein
MEWTLLLVGTRAHFLEHLSKSANVTASTRKAGFDRATAYQHRAAQWEDALQQSLDGARVDVSPTHSIYSTPTHPKPRKCSPTSRISSTSTWGNSARNAGPDIPSWDDITETEAAAIRAVFGQRQFYS